MRSAVNRARKSESGFTLIELLIVIVILGILAAIVVFSVSGITDRGKTSACKADVATATTAVEAWYAAQDPAPAGYPAAGAAAGQVQAVVVPGFIHTWPTDVTYTPLPASGPPYTTFSIVGNPACP